MAIIDAIINFRRFLKRRNCSRYTLRNYMSTLKQFVIWISEPIEQVSSRTVLAFILLEGWRLHLMAVVDALPEPQSPEFLCGLNSYPPKKQDHLAALNE